MALTTTGEAHLQALGDRVPALAPLAPMVQAAAEAICRGVRAGGQVLTCGNGGSASDAEHIVGELMKGFVLPRPLPAADVARLRAAGLAADDPLPLRLQCGVPAIALTGHAPLATAIQNDTDPSLVFAQQVYVLGRPGDVLIALSTSGNARNVVQAATVARAFGLVVIGFTGRAPAALDAVCDLCLKAPATDTYRVQEYHLPLYHTLCLLVEAMLFGA